MSRQVALLWGAVSASLLALAPFAPRISEGLWACAFKSFTGIACPTCGVTRAALALARLDVLEALVRYPLPTVGWTIFLAGGILSAGLALLGRRPPEIPRRLPVPARVAIVALVLANWGYSIATGV